MDLVSTSERSPASARWPGRFCAQPSAVDTSAPAPDEIKASCCQARLDRIQSCTSRAFLVSPSPYDTVGVAPPHPDHSVVHSSSQGRFPVCPILRIDPVFDLRCVLCLVPRQ